MKCPTLSPNHAISDHALYPSQPTHVHQCKMTKTATWLWVQLGGPIEYKAKGILGNQSLFILQLFVTGQQSSICVVLLWRHWDGEQRQRGREWFSEAKHTHTAESTEKRDECRSERECLNFGLNRLEPAISAVSPVSADTSQVSANQPDLTQIGPSLNSVGASRRKKQETTWQTRPDARSAASLARCRVAPHWTRVRRLWSRVRASQRISKKVCKNACNIV